MDAERTEELKRVSQEVRKDILRMVSLAGSGPFEISMSAARLLVFLYWEELLVTPESPTRDDRDRVILNIPEAVPALYAILAKRGFFEREHLWHYRRLGAMLQALPDLRRTPGIDAPCVSVEPALAMADALASSLNKGPDSPRVVFITSDAAFRSDDFKEEIIRAGAEACPGLIMIVLVRLAVTKESRYELLGQTALFRNAGWLAATADCEDFTSLEKAFEDFALAANVPKVLFAAVSHELGLSVSDSGSSNTPHALSLGDLDKALEELEVKSDEKK